MFESFGFDATKLTSFGDPRLSGFLVFNVSGGKLVVYQFHQMIVCLLVIICGGFEPRPCDCVGGIFRPLIFLSQVTMKFREGGCVADRFDVMAMYSFAFDEQGTKSRVSVWGNGAISGICLHILLRELIGHNIISGGNR